MEDERTTDAAFGRWMATVDSAIAQRAGGLISLDLPDCPYWAWWASGVSATSAARRAIQAADS